MFQDELDQVFPYVLVREAYNQMYKVRYEINVLYQFSISISQTALLPFNIVNVNTSTVCQCNFTAKINVSFLVKQQTFAMLQQQT